MTDIPEPPRRRSTRRQRTRWDTMDEAFQSAQQSLAVVQREVFDAIKDVPQTCDELEVSLGRTHQSVSPTIHRLRELGLIEASNVKRLTRSGKPAIVWQVKSDKPADDSSTPISDSLFPMPPLRWRIG